MDDLISRQAAIKALEDAGMTNYLATGDFYGIINALTVIKNMPTANPSVLHMKIKADAEAVKKAMQDAELTLLPAEKKGKWIIQSDTYHEYWECDQCGMGVGLDDVRNYCPNCGARMEESE